ncbi:hypothetical protein AAFF_G00008230 [Aldrovandia affinis]|uniref:Uncharacterized protein n=1 Tax=Aldrovandia affinis TaxID=143900 RepID=A0AAD7WZV2_9TELE|nr:hypothetical protein AAFF_G00008230 [Aldrovandia affinis]
MDHYSRRTEELVSATAGRPETAQGWTASTIRKMHGTQLMAVSPPSPVVGSPRPRVTSTQTRSPTKSLQECPWPVFHGSADPASDDDMLTEMGNVR